MTAGDEVLSRYFASINPDQGDLDNLRASAQDTNELPDAISEVSRSVGKIADALRRGPHLDAPMAAFIDDLSSDSSLTDVLSDVSSICAEDSLSSAKSPSTRSKDPRSKGKKVSRPTKSPYFPTKRPEPVSCLRFPPISATSFGLVQEKLAHQPFRLLLATVFLNRTRGAQAMPVFYRLLERYPTIPDMAAANIEEVVSMIHGLGFQNQRARKCIEIAEAWLGGPPERGKRYRKLDYPNKRDGKDVEPGTCIDDDDPRIAWEIAHLPGLGAYALDSWRIFCRDELRGLATDWNGEGAEDEFEPEWRSVLPKDKELRAYLTWMWLKVGWKWDKETGERTPADEKVMRAATRGGIAHEENGDWVLETSPVKGGLKEADLPKRNDSQM